MENNRKCAYSNQILSKDKLIRFVKTKSGEFFFDKDKNIQGRGAYLKKDLQIIEEAFKKRVLNRSFKQKIEIEIYKKLQKEVEEWLKNLKN